MIECVYIDHFFVLFGCWIFEACHSCLTAEKASAPNVQSQPQSPGGVARYPTADSLTGPSSACWMTPRSLQCCPHNGNTGKLFNLQGFGSQKYPWFSCQRKRHGMGVSAIRQPVQLMIPRETTRKVHLATPWPVGHPQMDRPNGLWHRSNTARQPPRLKTADLACAIFVQVD